MAPSVTPENVVATVFLISAMVAHIGLQCEHGFSA